MAYQMRMGEFHVVTMPGENDATGTETLSEATGVVTKLATGETFRGDARTGMPSAAIQRRAMTLADVTGAQVTSTRGAHYAPVYSERDGRTWSVQPAEHYAATRRRNGESVDMRTGARYVVTVSERDGIIGYRHTRHNYRTWSEVLAFIAYHFPAPKREPRPESGRFSDVAAEAAWEISLSGFTVEEAGESETVDGYNALVDVSPVTLRNVGATELADRFAAFLDYHGADAAAAGEALVWVRQSSDGQIVTVEWGHDGGARSGTDAVNKAWDAYIAERDDDGESDDDAEAESWIPLGD